MNHIEDEEEEFSTEDIKALAFTVAFFTLVVIGLVCLFVYAVIKFI